MNVRDYLFMLVIVVLIGLLVWREVTNDGVVRIVQTRDTIIFRDTIQVTLPAKVHYKKVYVEKFDTGRKSSIVEVLQDTSTWIACADTMIKKTTINVCFFYPKKEFSLHIAYRPDTIEKTVIVEKPLVKLEQPSNRWYYDVGKFGGGLLLGFLLGRVK